MESCDGLYTMQEIPGKGHGLVATTAIKKGTRILSESPLFRVARGGHSREHLRENILKTIAALREDQRQAFLSLHNSFEDEDGPELGRIRTNALPLGSNAIEGGIFLNSSRINHSCRPNAQNTWNEDLQKLTIHANQDISKGEEITIFYLTSRGNRDSRLRTLQTSFHFTCSCSLCSLVNDQRKMSDQRWEEIQRLDDSIGNGTRILSAPLQTLHDVQSLLNLLDNESIFDASVPRAYYDAFQIAITHGDIARATVFAERASSTREILEGIDSPTVHKLKLMVRDPTQHMAYGCSEKWKTTLEDVPRNLNDAAFERWLWRNEASKSLQYANFRDEKIFPTFAGLPEENEISLEFFDTEDGFSYHPTKHWCFLAEILEVETIIRLRFIVKDKSNRIIPVAFYIDDSDFELGSSFIQKGFTIAILYAEQHPFLDLSTGIRLEEPAMIKIFPLPLDKLLALSDKIQRYATEIGGVRTCQGCNQKGTSLKQCARCGLFWYCNKSCQIAGWTVKGHKEDCKVLKDPELRRLFDIKWDVFDDYHRFGRKRPN